MDSFIDKDGNIDLTPYCNPSNLSERDKELLPEILEYLEEKVEEIFKTSESFEEYENSDVVITYTWLNRVQKLFDDYTLQDFYEYEGELCGDLMTIEEFIECCNCGCFTDYDGSGHYATKDQQSTITIDPSDIISNIYRKDFTHVIWFNK